MRLTNLLLHELPGQLPATHTRDWIPGGYMGTAATIARMRDFVTQYKRDFKIRKVAADIIRSCAGKDYYCYAKKIYEFCRDRIKYAYDPHMVELVESPERVLEAGIADCDSICTLLAALNESIGLKTRFRTVKADAKRPNDFSHVYCVVRVPASKYSTSSASGWIPEDPTLPDKTFGWEPPGMLGHKDWAASKDKDGEDELGIGDVVMSPQSESQAQMEINSICQDLNSKLVKLLRSGIQMRDPASAQAVSNGVSAVTRAASGPGSPLQKLPAVRNGYSFWSNSMDQYGAQITTPQLPPNFSGYSAMAGLGVDDDTNVRWMNSYIAQIGDRISRLSAANVKSEFPEDIALVEALYGQMRQEAAYGDKDSNARERKVYRLYKEAVVIAQRVAQKMYNIGKRVDLPEEIKNMKADSWWDTLVNTVKAIPRVVAGEPHVPTVVYPEQDPSKVPAPPPVLTKPYTPGFRLPGEELVLPDGTIVDGRPPGIPWLPIGIVAAAAGLGLFLYIRQHKKVSAPAKTKRTWPSRSKRR
jgi:hypothetical protein